MHILDIVVEAFESATHEKCSKLNIPTYSEFEFSSAFATHVNCRPLWSYIQAKHTCRAINLIYLWTYRNTYSIYVCVHCFRLLCRCVDVEMMVIRRGKRNSCQNIMTRINICLRILHGMTTSCHRRKSPSKKNRSSRYYHKIGPFKTLIRFQSSVFIQKELNQLNLESVQKWLLLFKQICKLKLNAVSIWEREQELETFAAPLKWELIKLSPFMTIRHNPSELC